MLHSTPLPLRNGHVLPLPLDSKLDVERAQAILALRHIKSSPVYEHHGRSVIATGQIVHALPMREAHQQVASELRRVEGPQNAHRRSRRVARRPARRR